METNQLLINYYKKEEIKKINKRRTGIIYAEKVELKMIEPRSS